MTESREPAYQLSKALGVVAVIASTLATEYGTGINFVSVQSLSVYPGVHGLVPLAMLVTGLALLPKAYLFAVFSNVMPRAGSTHVWVARSLGMPAGFLTAFLFWVSGPAAMGVLGYAFVTFLGQGLAPMNAALSGLLLSRSGHLIFGLAGIWIAFAVNAAGIRQYGILVTAALILIVAVALTISAIGFLTPPHIFVTAASVVAKVQLSKPVPLPADSPAAFIGVCGLFVFSYTGLVAGPALGGEVINAEKKVPLGIYFGWGLITVLFTSIAAALFHAAPWWAVAGLIKAGQSSYATAPGLIGLVAPNWLSVALNLAVALIVWKTLVPNLMMSSRFCFAQAQDRLLPAIFARTSSRKVPLPALVLMAALGSLFLVQSVFFGWTMGVAVRSLAVLGIWLGVAVGALNLWRRGPRRQARWARTLCGRKLVMPAAILSIIISVPLIVALAVVPKAPFFLQPLFQAIVILGIGTMILAVAAARAKRRGESLASIAAQLPLE